MSLKVGIIGLPNVGKSTIFNALTKSSIPSENYPFCTIEPNIGIVQVPDNRLNHIVNIFNCCTYGNSFVFERTKFLIANNVFNHLG